MSQIRFTTVLSALGRFALAAVISSAILGGTARLAEASEPDTETKTMVVSTSGLDLAKATDRGRLAHRIDVAARKVCWEPSDYGLQDSGAFLTCYRAAVEGAQPGVTAAITAATKVNVVASAEK